MKKIVRMSVVAAMMMGVGSVSAQAEGLDIVSNVKVSGEIRPRYEMVDQEDAANKDSANAFTNRLTIGASGDLLGTDWLSAYGEMTNVSALNDNYNDNYAGNGSEPHDKVVDPEQTRLTQAYLDFKMAKSKLRAGRQMINLDNQRFVGAVGWRQMFQTFDAVTVTSSDIENLNLFASYVTQVNGIGYDQATDTRTLLLNASYKVMDELKVTAYGYLIGENSVGEYYGGSDTYGASLTGNVKVSDDVKVDYRAEYAVQVDPSMETSGFGGADVKQDANYMNFELNANVMGILLGAQYEVLSGDGDGAGDETRFQTPLATLHAHNGYADMFLSTPVAGLEDLNFTLGYKSKDLGTLKATYHDFSSEVGSVDYANEIDVLYTNKIPGVNNLTGTLKYVSFNADNDNGIGLVDMTKFVAMLDYKFATK